MSMWYLDKQETWVRCESLEGQGSSLNLDDNLAFLQWYSDIEIHFMCLDNLSEMPASKDRRSGPSPTMRK